MSSKSKCNGACEICTCGDNKPTVEKFADNLLMVIAITAAAIAFGCLFVMTFVL